MCQLLWRFVFWCLNMFFKQHVFCLSMLFHTPCSPHLCVGGLFLVVHFRLPLPSSMTPARPTHPHTTCSSHTTWPHTNSHTTYSHTQLVHTQLTHTQLTHTNLLTHTTCPHTTYSHTTYSHKLTHTHTQLVHTQLTHTQLTHTHTTCPHTTCHHTTCSHTTCSQHNLLTHNLTTHKLTHNLLTHNLSTHNSGGTLGSQLTPWTPRLFAWQAWHLSYWAGSVARLGWVWRRGRRRHLRGRRGTSRHRPSLCVAGLALVVLGWLQWRAWVGFRAVVAAAVCVAGVVLRDIDLHFAWQAWHLWHWAGSHTIFDTPLCHTPSFTHHLSHTTSSHTTFDTPLCHTPSFTHHLCHTTLSHTIFHTSSFTPLCDTPCFTHHLWHTIFYIPSFTHNFVTHILSHTHTTLSHPLFHTQLSHTLPFTHNFVTHHLSHTISDTRSFRHHFVTHHLWHAIFHTHHLSHTQLCHTPPLTHHFVTHHLSHTIFVTPLCHTPSFTHHFVTYHLPHTIFDTPSLTHHLSHTTLSHTIFDTPSFTHIIFHTQLCHTPSYTHHLWHTIFDTPSLAHHFVTHHLWHTIFHTQLCHTPSFTHRHGPSFTHHLSPHHLSHTHNFVTHHLFSTSSFVFPSFPVPAATFVAHYWKKLTCGVIRSLFFFKFHICGWSLQGPQLIVVVAYVHELCAKKKKTCEKSRRKFTPHSSALNRVFWGFHSHASALTQQVQKLPNQLRTHAALTPHSRHTHIFSSISWMSLIRTHVVTNAYSPNSSALIRTHCAPLRPRRMLNDFRLTRKWADTYQKSLWRLDMPLHGIAYHQPNRWFRYMSQNHKTYLFFCKNHLCKKTYISKSTKRLSSITPK